MALLVGVAHGSLCVTRSLLSTAEDPMDPDQKKKCSDVLEYFFALDSTGAYSAAALCAIPTYRLMRVGCAWCQRRAVS